MRIRYAVPLVAGALVLGSMLSVGAQEPPKGSSEPRGSAKPQAQQTAMRGPLIRSEALYEGTNGGPTRTVRQDFGLLQSIENGTFVLLEKDATTVRVPTDGSAKLSRDGKDAKLADFKTGDHVTTVRTQAGSAATHTDAVSAISDERYQQAEKCRQDPESCKRAAATPTPTPRFPF